MKGQTRKVFCALMVMCIFALSGCALVTVSTPALGRTVDVAPAKASVPSYAILISLNETQSGLIARRVDADTLADLPGETPVDLQHHYAGVLSPDRRRWAVVTFPNSDDRGGVLHLVDVASWQDKITPLKFHTWPPVMVFSADGARLVIAETRWVSTSRHWGADLSIINPNAPEEALRSPVDFIPERAQFSPDARQLFVYGARADPYSGLAEAPRVAAIDTATGVILWSLELTGVRQGGYDGRYYRPGVAFSPDGRWLHIVHADVERLTTVDLTAGTAVSVAIAEPLSLLEWLAGLFVGTASAKGPMSGAERSAVLSPDGARLYVTGVQTEARWQSNRLAEVSETPLGLEMIDVRTGRCLLKQETDLASGLFLSPDGRWLYLRHRPPRGTQDTDPSAPGVEVFDAETLALVAHLALGADYANLGFSVSRDRAYLSRTHGEPTTTTIEALDTTTYERLATRDVPGWIGELILP